MAGLRTEFPFTLPKGFVDPTGTLHRHGTMRLATARDEIEPLRDRTVTGPDDPYLTILVLARVISELGTLDQVSPGDVENFFAADLAFLQDLYGIINFGEPADVEALQASVLPPEPAPEPESEREPSPASQFEAESESGIESDSEAESDAGDHVTTIGTGGSTRRRGHIEEVPRTRSS